MQLEIMLVWESGRSRLSGEHVLKGGDSHSRHRVPSRCFQACTFAHVIQTPLYCRVANSVMRHLSQRNNQLQKMSFAQGGHHDIIL